MAIPLKELPKIYGKVVFVPGAILGERVHAKIIKSNKDYEIAKIDNILKTSDFREEPICSAYKLCGGCNALHINYNMQLKQKRKMVENLLHKVSMDSSMLKDTIGMGIPYYYRNKVQYPIRIKDGKNVLGFYQKRSHSIVENECCFIQDRIIDEISKEVFKILDSYEFSGCDEEKNIGEIRNILVRRGYHTGEIMVVIVINKKSLVKNRKMLEVVKKISDIDNNIKGIFLNLNEYVTNEILGENTYKLFGDDYIKDKIGDFVYYISPKSFFQVNTTQAEVLYLTLKENLHLSGDEVLFDLYSGVGSIGIFLSDRVKSIYGIEIEKEAVKMANLNLKINNVSNGNYIAGSVEEKIREFEKENIKPDVIVIDPPRKGLDQRSIEYILKFNPKKIGYISCNPATLVRDLKILEKKYEITTIIPVDMFPQTRTC